MSLSCYVEGAGEEPLSKVEWTALAAWIETMSNLFEWDCEPFQLPEPSNPRARELSVYTKLQQGEETEFDRDLCQCVELTYRLSKFTPGWTWHVSDDIECLAMCLGGPLLIRDGTAVTKDDSGEIQAAPGLEEEMQSYMAQSIWQGALRNAPKAPTTRP